MYVRMFWGRVKAGKWDEYERFYNEKVSASVPTHEGGSWKSVDA